MSNNNTEHVKIHLRRGPESTLPILDAGEPAFTTDTDRLFIGDGAVNHQLAQQDNLDGRGINVMYPPAPFVGAKGDYNGTTGLGTDDTQALLALIALGKTLYFPTGNYQITTSNIDLLKGTVLKGDGTGKTVITFNVPSGTTGYALRMNLYTGFDGIRIVFKNNFNGDAILFDPGYISSTNNNVYHFERNYIFKNVEIDFVYKSGYGNGLTLRVTNYDASNSVYNSNVRNYLDYFYVENFEVEYGNKAINVVIDQKNPVTTQVWMTATRFKKIRSNSCVYGIYFNVTNSGSSGLLDISDILFSDVEIQTSPANFFASTTSATTALYVNSTDRLVLLNFEDLTIWDSTTTNGYINNAIVSIRGFYSSSPPTPVNTSYKQRFQLGATGRVDADIDIRRIRLTATDDGTVTEINPIAGGIKFINNPEGANGGSNGYTARGQLYEQEVAGTLYSKVFLEDYDKNGTRQGYIEMGKAGVGFKGVANQGIFNLMTNAADGTPRQVLNWGNEGIIYNDQYVDKGYYSGNGVYVKMETTADIAVPVNAGYQTVSVPIKEIYTFYPMLTDIRLYDVDNQSTLGVISPEDVTIRQAYVNSKTAITVVLKHTKSSPINLKFRFVVSGYKTFTTTVGG